MPKPKPKPGQSQTAARRRPRPRAAAVKALAPRQAGYQSLDFTRKNWVILACGVGAVVLGFFFLSTGDITFAPILLVGGYLGLIPWALVAKAKRSEADPKDEQPIGRLSGSKEAGPLNRAKE